MLKYRARQPGFPQVHPLGALTIGLEGKRLTEMAELAEAGCIAFGQASVSMVDTQVLMRAMQYAATFFFPVWLQAQDAHLTKGGVAHDGAVSARLGLTGIPVEAETIALATILQLAKTTGVRLHIRRVSSAAGLALIRAARADGLLVTCDIYYCVITISASSMPMPDSTRRCAQPPTAMRWPRDWPTAASMR
jgi:dihydroorotase